MANKLGKVKQAHVAADVEEGLKIGAIRWLKQTRPHVMWCAQSPCHFSLWFFVQSVERDGIMENLWLAGMSKAGMSNKVICRVEGENLRLIVSANLVPFSIARLVRVLSCLPLSVCRPD